MTRKILNILIMLGSVAILFLSSCTAAGVECGLLGKWENTGKVNVIDDVYTFTYTYEIRSDDKIVFRAKMKNSSNKIISDEEKEYTIKSASDHKIKYDNDNEIEYRNLTYDSVEFKIGLTWMEFNKLY